MELGMREPYIEGVAIHGDPESCVGDPRGRSEALTGARAGWAIEPRNQAVRCRRRVYGRKATSRAALSQAASGPRAVEEPVHARNLHVRDPGGPTVARRVDGAAGRSGKAKAVIPRWTSVGSQTGP